MCFELNVGIWHLLVAHRFSERLACFSHLLLFVCVCVCERERRGIKKGYNEDLFMDLLCRCKAIIRGWTCQLISLHPPL